jgi:hypothetical protein
MGNIQKAAIGTRSSRTHLTKLQLEDENVNYKDKKYMKKAKEELYDLFCSDKLIHVEKIAELVQELDILENDNKNLTTENQNYKKLLDNYKQLTNELKDKIKELHSSIKEYKYLEEDLKNLKEKKLKEDSSSSEEETSKNSSKKDTKHTNEDNDEDVEEYSEDESEEENNNEKKKSKEDEIKSVNDILNSKKLKHEKPQSPSTYNIEDIENKLAIIKNKLRTK